MPANIRLALREDGDYDLILESDYFESEFSLEFLSGDNLQKGFGNLSEFVKKHSKNLKIKNVKISAAGKIAAEIPYDSLFDVSAAEI